MLSLMWAEVHGSVCVFQEIILYLVVFNVALSFHTLSFILMIPEIIEGLAYQNDTFVKAY